MKYMPVFGVEGPQKITGKTVRELQLKGKTYANVPAYRAKKAMALNQLYRFPFLRDYYQPPTVQFELIAGDKELKKGPRIRIFLVFGKKSFGETLPPLIVKGIRADLADTFQTLIKLRLPEEHRQKIAEINLSQHLPDYQAGTSETPAPITKVAGQSLSLEQTTALLKDLGCEKAAEEFPDFETVGQRVREDVAIQPQKFVTVIEELQRFMITGKGRHTEGT